MGPILLALLAMLVVAYGVERRRRHTAPMAGGLHPDRELAHQQEWELHHNSFSLCSKKLRVCLAELGIAYASHPVELIETGSYQNVGREFLVVNPAGTVPVLVHRGHPVYESHEQIVYAARHAGKRGRELLPEEPGARATVEHWIDVASIGDDPISGLGRRAGHCIPGLTVPLFATMVQYIPWMGFGEGLLFHPDKRRPVFLALLKQRGVERLPGRVLEMVTRSRHHMGQHLDALGALLQETGGPWIAGAHFTLADVSWVVVLDRLVEADWAAHFWGAGSRPEVAAYWERLQKRPSFYEAIESRRCATLRAGMADLAEAKRADPVLRLALDGGV